MLDSRCNLKRDLRPLMGAEPGTSGRNAVPLFDIHPSASSAAHRFDSWCSHQNIYTMEKNTLPELMEEISKRPFQELGASSAFMIVKDNSGHGHVMIGGKNMMDVSLTLLDTMVSDPHVAAAVVSAAELYQSNLKIDRHGSRSKSHSS